MAGVKTFFAPFRWFWLVTMATGYLFDFFDIFKTIIVYTPYLDTRLVSQGLWTWEPFQNYWDKAPSGNFARKKALRSSVSHADIDFTQKKYYLTEEHLLLRWRHLWINSLLDKKVILRDTFFENDPCTWQENNPKLQIRCSL